MSKKQIKSQIEVMIENGYAETGVGYHADLRMWDGNWRRGCYAHIAAPYGGTKRIYAMSWAALLEKIQQLRNDGDL